MSEEECKHLIHFRMRGKKGAIKLNDAPTIVMIVGFIFLLMATIAYVSEEYRKGMGTTKSGSAVNISGFAINDTTYTVSEASYCNFENFAVTTAYNATDGTVILAGNYTVDKNVGTIVGSTSRTANWTSVNITYTFDYGGTACNVTESLESELSDNTSIAGIVLTISLIAIVLAILISIFVGTRRRI